MASDSGPVGLECVADDQSSTAISTSSSSSGLLDPPAAKRTKRASKWQEEWKKYNMKQTMNTMLQRISLALKNAVEAYGFVRVI